MLRNYLTTALRTFRRRQGLSAITVSGLALGFGAALVMALFAQHELTYDAFHEDADAIYQVYKERDTPTGTQITRDTWVPLLPRLTADYPTVQDGARIYTQDRWVAHGDRRFEEATAYVDPAFFDLFTFPAARGTTALSGPNEAILTAETARHHFGDANPIGKRLTVDFSTEVTVVGVLKPIPTNSTIQFDLALPIQNLGGFEEDQDNWDGSFLTTYVRLQERADPDALEAQFPTLVASVFGPDEAERTRFRLQPLPTLQNALTDNHRAAWVLLGIAAAIVLIAALNFMNLAAAQSMDRAREIGVRKSLGAYRKQLTGQFLGESVLLSLAGVAGGAVLAQAALPFFNGLYGLNLSVGLVLHPVRLVIVVGGAVLVGLLAGSYPAGLLARFDPANTLKGTHTRTASGRFVRRGLVVVQFALSILLIVGTLAAWQQLQHMRTADVGVDTEHLLTVDTDLREFADARAAASRLRTFEQEVERIPGVATASFSSHVPGNWQNWFTFAHPGTERDDASRRRMRVAIVDSSYFETHGIGRLAGRTYADARAADTLSVILNEAAMADFGWTSHRGKSVRVGSRVHTVIGVVDDYHFQSVAASVEPVLHFYDPAYPPTYQNLTVRLQTADPHAVVQQMEPLWAEVDGTRGLPYTFVDQRFRQLYASEARMATVVSVFSGLAILIACMGLFGLAALSVAQRRHEIGIRKALGASVWRVAMGLSRSFLAWVAAAVLVALPAAYVLVQMWLQDFAMRIDLGPGLFLAAGGLALAVAAGTVAAQTIRAARLNPVAVLRRE